MFDGQADRRRNILTWSGETFGKRVSGISNVADANGTVVDHFALRVDTTRVGAG